jgi:hypothetical protein
MKTELPQVERSWLEKMYPSHSQKSMRPANKLKDSYTQDELMHWLYPKSMKKYPSIKET